ncbi:hypothetical protein K2173_005468 [Erythroxylum novogranatense]|uniref:Uncharacterized protein n=1 Tax=Erythroxylum novogranatense TaxID=1862640 RepID=A0AAV8SKR2_9ROSI|nr:hypothetical protein K2173_005468 [Erythroxylum novogranatense]
MKCEAILTPPSSMDVSSTEISEMKSHSHVASSVTVSKETGRGSDSDDDFHSVNHEFSPSSSFSSRRQSNFDESIPKGLSVLRQEIQSEDVSNKIMKLNSQRDSSWSDQYTEDNSIQRLSDEKTLMELFQDSHWSEEIPPIHSSTASNVDASRNGKSKLKPKSKPAIFNFSGKTGTSSVTGGNPTSAGHKNEAQDDDCDPHQHDEKTACSSKCCFLNLCSPSRRRRHPWQKQRTGQSR